MGVGNRLQSATIKSLRFGVGRFGLSRLFGGRGENTTQHMDGGCNRAIRLHQGGGHKESLLGVNVRKVAEMREARGCEARGEAKPIKFFHRDLKAKVLGEAGAVPFDDLVEVFGGDAEDRGDIEVEKDKLSADKAEMRGESVLFHIY